MQQPELTVIVITWQGAHLLADSLESLAAQTQPHEVLVVDNASTDGTDRLLSERFPDVRTMRLATNTGFAGGVAAALSRVTTPYVALLNNDAAADAHWLERSVRVLADRADVAAVTARMVTWEDPTRLNNAGVRLVRGGYGADRGLDKPAGPPFDTPGEVFGFSGGAAVLRTEVVRSAGGMPAEYFLYYEDTDLSWRLRLTGWRIWYEPSATVRHRHAATANTRSELFAYYNERNRLLMLLRCAPAGFAVAQLARFGLTTASLTVRRLARLHVPDAAVFRLRLRLRVLAGVLRMTPRAMRERAAISRSAVVPRAVVARTWIGRADPAERVRASNGGYP